LTEQNAVPLIVLSVAREPVEAVNSILRRAGQPAHCTWIPALRDLGDALTQLNPELLVHVADDHGELGSVIRVRDQLAPTVPVLLLVPAADEKRIALQKWSDHVKRLIDGKPAKVVQFGRSAQLVP